MELDFSGRFRDEAEGTAVGDPDFCVRADSIGVGEDGDAV